MMDRLGKKTIGIRPRARNVQYNRITHRLTGYCKHIQRTHLDRQTDRQTDRRMSECLPVTIVEGQCSTEAGARDAQLNSSGHDLPP